MTRRVVRAFVRSVVLAVGLVALAAVTVPVPTTTASAFDPVVTAEMPATHVVPGTAQAGLEPAIASGGNIHLAVWRPASGGLRATRIDRDGTVMDAPGIFLTRGEVGGSSPAVAFDGMNFLVVWLATDTVRAKRISPVGTVLDETSIPVSPPSKHLRHPAVAFDGINHLVIWTDLADGSGVRGDVHGTLLRPDGTAVGPIGSRISEAPGAKERPAVAFNGSHYLVVWDSRPVSPSGVRGTLVTTSGVALSPAGFPISTGPTDRSMPAVTAVGTTFFVAWADARNPGVYGARVDAAGSVLDPAGLPIARGAGPPSVASDGTGVLVTYRTPEPSPTTRAVLVDGSGAVLDPAGIALPTPGRAAVLTSGGDGYFVAAGGLAPIRGTRVSSHGAVLDPAGIVVSVAANNQTGVDLASDGTNSLMVWSDDRTRGEGPGLYGARIGPDGQVLDGSGFRIAAATGWDRPTGAAVVFDGTNYLVVWGEASERAVRAARVSRSGIVLGRFDVAVAAGPSDEVRAPVVASGGDVLLVVWTASTRRGAGDVHELRATRVSTAGKALDPGGLLISPLTTHEPFDVAFGRTNFMVVWQDRRGATKNVYATRVTTAGVVPSWGGFPVSTSDRWQTTPQIAWNGTTHLVVWSDRSEPADVRTADIRGARVDDSGNVLDPAGFAVSTAPNGQERPTVAANGPFLVAWLDRRKGLESSRAVFASRVDADAAVAHPDGFLVVPSIGLDDGPDAPVTATRGEGNFAVGYERLRIDAPYGSTRAALRKVAPK